MVLGGSAITVGDPDAGSNGLERMTLSASDGILVLPTMYGLSGVLGNGSGTVAFSGTITTLNDALNGLTYARANGFSGSDTIQVAIDNDGYSGTGGV